MKNILGIIIIIILLLFSSCNVLHKSNKEVFRITVLDEVDDVPINNARVFLVTIVNNIDIYIDTLYTDSHGKCKFQVNYPSSAQYQVRADKDGLLHYFEIGYKNLSRGSSFINTETGNNIKLYLTSDSLNHIKYWSSWTTRYETKTLINLLKSNKYPLRSEFPLLLWEDIPKLLEIGNSTTLINKYPMHIFSSTFPEDCYLGIVSLWFIESIRITELKKTVVPTEKFPSMTPSLHYQGKVDRNRITNSVEIMEKAYVEYLTWWNEVKDMDKDTACKIDPLGEINIKW